MASLKNPKLEFQLDDSEMIENNYSLLKLMIINSGELVAKDISIKLLTEIETVRNLKLEANHVDFQKILEEIKPGERKEIIFQFRPIKAGRSSLTILSSCKTAEGNFLDEKKDLLYVMIQPDIFKPPVVIDEDRIIAIADIERYRKQAIAVFSKGKNITDSERGMLDVIRIAYNLTKEQQKQIEDDVSDVRKVEIPRWSILASGEGAGRVASLYFIKMKNEAIENRILLMNDNRSDIINTLIDMEKTATCHAERNLINQIKQKNTLLFGGRGSGIGEEISVEESVRKDFENKIRRPIEALVTAAGDVFLHIVALGGGTGNGSIPYIIHQMKHGNSVSLQNRIHVALAIFPYSDELPQRQFNAICGLSRLLKFGDNSQQNADMVLMVDNSKIKEDIELSEGIDASFSDINKRIIRAIDLMIAPGRRAKGVIDIKDYVKFPSLMGLYHFTPCISVDNDINFIELEMALDEAVKNSFVHMDPKTAVIGYLIVSVPEKYLNKGDFTEDKINAIFGKWKKNNIIGKMGMVSLAFSGSKKDTFDVLLLLGGFSLKQPLEKSWHEFRSLKKILMMASEGGHVELDNVKISIEKIERIEGILNDYINHTDYIIKDSVKL